MTKAGKSAQKRRSNERSKPGHDASGRPIHGCVLACERSIIPNHPATTHPTRMPMRGAHNRRVRVPKSAMPMMTPKVVVAVIGAAKGTARSGSGTLFSSSKAIGKTLTAISMMTVPPTVGVTIRRSVESRPRKIELKQRRDDNEDHQKREAAIN